MSKSHSFVVKVWVEETSKKAGRGIWRGYITHVQSGVRWYFEDLGEIGLFMHPYLSDLNVELSFEQRLWWWLSCLRLNVFYWIKRRRRVPPDIGHNIVDKKNDE